MSEERWSKATWEEFLSMMFRVDHVSFVPHKIFRWDKHEIYRDCYFPVSCHHLLGGEHVLGAGHQRSLAERFSQKSDKSPDTNPENPTATRYSIGFSFLGKDCCRNCSAVSLCV